MSTNYHTAIAYGAEATSANVNSPLSELDTQLTTVTTEVTNARGSLGALDTRLDVSLEEDGTLGDDVVDAAAIADGAVGVAAIAAAIAGDGIQGGGGSALAVDVSDFAGTGLEDDGSENLRIAAAAAGDGLSGGGGSALAVDLAGGDDGLEFSGGQLTGTAASTSNVGVVKFCSSTLATSGQAIEGDDARLRRKIIYTDHSMAGGTTGDEASALTEYVMDDPGSNDSEDKIIAVYEAGLDPGESYVKLDCMAQVTADPDPQEAAVQVYITDGGVDTASGTTEITQFGSYAKLSVAVDTSGLTEGLHEIYVRIVWTSAAASGQTAKIKWCVLYTE